MEHHKICPCRCPCHELGILYHPIEQHKSQNDPKREVDHMSWANDQIQTETTYPHPPYHYPYGEEWNTKAPIPTGNPFKKLPALHRAITQSHLYVKDKAKTLTAFFESMSGSDEEKRSLLRNSVDKCDHFQPHRNHRDEKSTLSHSSPQNSHFVEPLQSKSLDKVVPPTSFSDETFVDTMNQTDPNFLQEDNKRGGQLSSSSFHTTNPFTMDGHDDEDHHEEKVSESIPPHPPIISPALLSQLMGHSVHCRELHAAMSAFGNNDFGNFQCASTAPLPVTPSKNLNSYSETTGTTTGGLLGSKVEDIDGGESKNSFSTDTPPCRLCQSSTSKLSNSIVSDDRKSEGREVDDDDCSFDFNRKSFQSETSSKGSTGEVKVILDQTSISEKSQSLSNDLCEEAQGEDNEDTNQETNVEENCIEKKSSVDVAVQTSEQRYRTEMHLTLENPVEESNHYQDSEPAKEGGEKELKEVKKDSFAHERKRSSLEKGRESTCKSADGLLPIVIHDNPHSSLPRVEDHKNDENPREEKLMNSTEAKDTNIVTHKHNTIQGVPKRNYFAWVSMPNKQPPSSHISSLERTEITIQITEEDGLSFNTDEKTFLAMEMSTGHNMQHATLNDQFLQKISEDYDSVEITPSNIQVEPIWQSVSVPNVNIPNTSENGAENHLLTRNSSTSTTTKQNKNSEGNQKAVCLCKNHIYVCHHCHKIVDSSTQAYHLLGPSSFSSKAWHASCFKCHVCSKQLSETNHSFYDGELYCMEHYMAATSISTCPKCQKLILDPTYISAGGDSWHRNCFTCHGCHKQLVDTKYVLVQQRFPYCFRCHEKNFPKQCRTCQKRIFPEEPYVQSGSIFWHSNQDCLHCSTCGGSLLGRQYFFKKADRLYCNRYCALSN